jgi:hypothetical protein
MVHVLLETKRPAGTSSTGNVSLVARTGIRKPPGGLHNLDWHLNFDLAIGLDVDLSLALRPSSC